MEEKLKQGYNLIINQSLIGELQGAYLHDDNGFYVPKEELNENDLAFLSTLPQIENEVTHGKTFAMSYNDLEEHFVADIREKVYGAKNENPVWKVTRKTEDCSMVNALLQLNNQIIITKKEGRNK